MDSNKKGVDAETLNMIKHDIKNQLSNIGLLIVQLKYDLQDLPPEQLEYLEMIALSATKIDAILNSTN